MNSNLDKSKDNYLKAWIGFYIPVLIPHFESLKNIIIQRIPLKEFKSRIPQTLSKDDYKTLVSKKS